MCLVTLWLPIKILTFFFLHHLKKTIVNLKQTTKKKKKLRFSIFFSSNRLITKKTKINFCIRCNKVLKIKNNQLQQWNMSWNYAEKKKKPRNFRQLFLIIVKKKKKKFNLTYFLNLEGLFFLISNFTKTIVEVTFASVFFFFPAKQHIVQFQWFVVSFQIFSVEYY